jgi:hypothetical protein
VLAGPWVRNELWRRARAVPSLDLRFADNKSLVDATTGRNLITFTRASSGTYVDSQGVIRTATTNLLLRSEEFGTTWSTVDASITPDTTTAPNGTVTADKLIENTVNATHRTSQSVAIASPYTLSCSFYAKAGERSRVGIWFRGASSTNRTQVTFNLSTGLTSELLNTGLFSGGVASMTAVGDGWYRCSLSANCAAGETAAQVTFYLMNNTVTISNATYIGDGASGLYLWGAQLEQSSTVGEYVPTTSTINSAPRFDHNPTTGESLGLLVEEQRTNSVTNNTMVGAVAGTPGTNPTGWVYATAQSNGLTISIAGAGVENGINYIDYRFNGTTVASPNACAIGIVNATAATAQTWTASTYWKLAAGTTAGTNAWQLGLIENTAGGTFVTGAFYSQTAPTSAALITQRPTATRTLSGGGTVGMVTLPINIPVAGNTAIDFTLRIGLPQLEQGAFATSVIPTSTAAVTRSADVASITGTAFSSWYRQDEGTMYGDYIGVSNISGGTRRLVEIGISGGTNDRIVVGYSATTLARMLVVVGGTSQADLTPVAQQGSTVKLAAAFAANDFQLATNSSLSSVDSVGSVPSVSALSLGADFPGAANTNLNGTIRRLCFWPKRLPASSLAAITQ